MPNHRRKMKTERRAAAFLARERNSPIMELNGGVSQRQADDETQLDVRVIAATNSPLDWPIKDRKFPEHDTYDPSPDAILCVYGYFTKGTGAANVV